MTVAVDEDGSPDLDALTPVEEDALLFFQYVEETGDWSLPTAGLVKLACDRPDGKYLLADVWQEMEDAGEHFTREE